jgi:two-component system NarL family response regulator
MPAPPESPAAIALTSAIAQATTGAELAKALADELTGPGPDDVVRLWETAGGRPEEVARHPLWRMLPELRPATVLRAARSAGLRRSHGSLLLPLNAGGASLGVLELHLAHPPDASLLKLAAHATAARFQLVCADGGRLLHPAGDNRDEVQAVVSEFAVQAKRVLDHDRLSIYLLSTDGTALERFAVGTSPLLAGEAERLTLEDSGLSRVVLANRGFVTDDVATDARTSGLEDRFFCDAGFHGLVTVPLRLAGRAFGVLSFASLKVGFYGPGDLAVAQQTADQIAVFLQNLRLQRSHRRAAEREATERERDRLAREFQHSPARQLVALTAAASALSERAHAADPELARAADDLRAQTERVLEDTRRSIFDMVPRELEASPLDDALRGALERLRHETGVDSTISAIGRVRELPAGVQAAVFRIVEDSLHAVRERPSGQVLELKLRLAGDLRLSVRVQGPQQAVEADAERVANMRRRAEAIGGRLNLTSAPDHMEVVLTVPGAGTFLVNPEPQSAERPAGSNGAIYDRVIRLLVVERQPALRAGLRALLETAYDVGVVGEADNARNALTAVRLLQPDVVLLGDLSDRSTAEATADIAGDGSGPAVLVLSSTEAASSVSQTLAAGASGYLGKSADTEAIVNAVRAVHGGATVIRAAGWTATSEGQELAPREMEALELIAAGASNADAAAQLGFAVKTLERVVADAVRKLGARNRTQAVAIAVSRGIVDVAEIPPAE